MRVHFLELGPTKCSCKASPSRRHRMAWTAAPPCRQAAACQHAALAVDVFDVVVVFGPVITDEQNSIAPAPADRARGVPPQNAPRREWCRYWPRRPRDPAASTLSNWTARRRQHRGRKLRWRIRAVGTADVPTQAAHLITTAHRSDQAQRAHGAPRPFSNHPSNIPSSAARHPSPSTSHPMHCRKERALLRQK